MADATYDVIEHDGGWAYKIGDTISKRYPSYESALIAGSKAAGRPFQEQTDHETGSDASHQKADNSIMIHRDQPGADHAA